MVVIRSFYKVSRARFNKIYCSCYIFSFFSTGIYSQSQGIKWQHPLGSSAGDGINSSLLTQDGNILVVSETFGNNGDVTAAHGLSDVWVCKLTLDGRIIWSKTLGSSGQDYFLNMHSSPDGGYILVMRPGANNGDVIGYKGLTDVFVVKLSSSGVIEWKNCIGGSSSDNYVSSFVQPDGSLLIFGNSFSNDEIFSGNHGSSDIFICKLDVHGNLVSVAVYGGNDSETVQSVIVKRNGNYLIYGRTLSNNSGQIGATKGATDLILMEVTNSGTFLWCKSYGGSLSENPSSMIQAGVNKFFLFAETSSSNGDMVGGHGQNDIWVGVTDSMGTLLSTKTLGGSLNEAFSGAYYAAADSSILLTVSTSSSNGDLINYHGGTDIWVLKINNQGTVQWNKCFGGSGNETLVNCQLNNLSTYFLARTTSNDGDITDNHGKTDFWIGLINESGNIMWQKCLGGSEDDLAKRMFIDSNQIIVAGDVNSKDGNVSGMHAKSDTLVGDTTTRITYYPDLWTAGLSISGTLNWQKAIGGFNSESLQNLLVDGKDLYVAASSQSNDGDVFKNHGAADIWVVRLGPSNTISGKVFVDNNLNGIMEPGEPYLNNVIIESKKNSYNRSSFSYDGRFKNETDTGSYNTSVLLNLPYYTSVPSSITSSFASYFNTDSVIFALQPIPGKKDLAVNAIALSFARPGFNTSYKLFYKNVGTTTIPSGEVLFIKDSRMSLLSSMPATSSSNGDTLKWNYTNLAPADTASITLQLRLLAPPATNNGDTLTSIASITPLSGEENPADNTSIIRHIVSGSFDPNNKYENYGGVISPAQIANGAYLNYTIRFQNTGTDTAFTVVIRDTLANNLDLSSLQMINASHAYDLSATDGDKLAWTFNHINLPDSNRNEPASHGFIVYHVKPKATVTLGDTINNTAFIYFDFNLPVPTDNALTVVRDNITLPLRLLDFSASDDNDITRLEWTTQGEYDFEKFVIQRSTNGKDFETIGTRLSNGNRSSISKYNFTDNLAGLQNEVFYYRLKMIDRDDRIKYSAIIMIRRRLRNHTVTVFPNPVSKGTATASVISEKEALATIKLTDINGKVLWSRDHKLNKGTNYILLNDISLFKAGIYVMQVTVGSQTYNKKLSVGK